jgi:hypothetical protein
MLSSNFTSVFTKPVQVSSSGVITACIYILALNSNPDESRTLDFFFEVGSVQSIHRSISVQDQGTKTTVMSLEVPPGDYTLTVYAKADKDKSVSLASVAVSIR